MKTPPKLGGVFIWLYLELFKLLVTISDYR